MGDAIKHEHSWPHGGPPWARGGGGMQAFFIPIPMAFFGVVISFMFGFTIGSMVGRKHAAIEGGGWRKHAMGGMGMGHHHHGNGAPPCRVWHEGWPQGQEPPGEDVEE